MKIIKEDIIYVQLEDINYIVKKGINFPSTLVPRTIEQGYVFIDENDLYNFIGYNDKEIIDFFKEQDSIIDYDEIKDYSIDKLVKICDRFIDNRDLIFEEYNSLSKYEKERNVYKLDEIKELEYKYYQVNKFLLYKSGNDKLLLPEGVNFPKKDNILKNIFKRK